MTLDETFERIVYMLDRSLAPAPKVRAFIKARGIAGEVTVSSPELGARHVVEFAREAGADPARLELRPAFNAVPIAFRLDPGLPLEQIFIGPQLVTPRSHDFVLALRDRHGFAWNDLDGMGNAAEATCTAVGVDDGVTTRLVPLTGLDESEEVVVA